MVQHRTCYARPIYPLMNTYHLYKVHSEALSIVCMSDARKPERSPVPRGGITSPSVPLTWRRCMNHSCYRRKKIKGRAIEYLANAASFFSFSYLPKALVLRCPSFPGWRGQMFRTNVECFVHACCCCSLITAKWCRSCWSFRVVGYVIVSKHGIQVGRLHTPV